MAQWVKTSPWGDYRDKEQNHKDNSHTEQYNLVHMIKKYGGKHNGSKAMHTLRSYAKKYNQKRQNISMKSIINTLKDITNKA